MRDSIDLISDPEAMLLAAVLAHPSEIDTAMAAVDSSSFANPTHVDMWQRIVDRSGKGDDTTAHNVASLGWKGQAQAAALVLARLSDETMPSRSEVKGLAKLVGEAHRNRALAAAGRRLAEVAAEGGDVGDAIAEVESASSGASDAPVWLTSNECVRDAMWYAQAVAQGEIPRGTKTGYADIDALTDGHHPGRMTIIAGRPAMGKTSLAMGMARNQALAGEPVGFVSLEMTARELTMRNLCALAGVESARIKNNSMNVQEWRDLGRAAGQLATAPLYVTECEKATLTGVIAAARQLKRKHGIKVLYVDYLQLLSPGAESRYNNRTAEVGVLSVGMKRLAKNLSLCVVPLSQLSRAVEARQVKRPMLSDLRESGSLEQDADEVIFVYRPEYYEPDNIELRGYAEAILAKHRHGPTGTVPLTWVAKYADFRNRAAGDR